MRVFEVSFPLLIVQTPSFSSILGQKVAFSVLQLWEKFMD